MDTEALIEALARETAPVPRRALEQNVGKGILAGASLALLLVVAGIGVRPDLVAAAHTTIFWGKAAYTASLGLIGLLLAMRLARPEPDRLRRAWLIALPIAVLAAFAAAELSAVPALAGPSLVVDAPWSCLPLILGLTAPVFVGLIWAFRRMAPTRLNAAGAATGLASAGVAATLYGLYCQQASPTTILICYTAAIAVASAAGALLGPRLLRW